MRSNMCSRVVEAAKVARVVAAREGRTATVAVGMEVEVMEVEKVAAVMEVEDLVGEVVEVEERVVATVRQWGMLSVQRLAML